MDFLKGFGFHVLTSEQLLAYLRRAHAGEDPDTLVAEAWSDHENVDNEDDPRH